MREKNFGLFVLAGVVALTVWGCGSHSKEEVSMIDENHFDQLASTTDAPGNAAAGVEVMADGTAAPSTQASAPIDASAGAIAADLANATSAANTATTAQTASATKVQPLAEKVALKAGASYEQKVQAALKSAGYYSGTVDGKIGTKTREAIKSFQTANGLKADGVVGPGTWEKLKKYSN